MNVKKIAMLVALIGMSGFFLAACGNKEADNSEIKDGKQVDFQKDAVDKKTKTVDGKEVTEYTMPDGNVIQIQQMVRKFQKMDQDLAQKLNKD